MKVALVHDFLTQLGGAERVLEQLHKIFPGAPVFTLVYDKRRTAQHFEGWNIKTSFLQHLPGMPGKYKWYLPLMRRAIESFDFLGFDVVLSDASAFAKGVIVPDGIPHICYCHTPTRYLWQDKKSYVESLPYPGFLKVAVKPVLNHFQEWDYQAAQRVSRFIANSQEVKNRISKYYKRDSKVIYPPVNTQFFKPESSKKQDYFLCASRLEPYKRIDLVVDVFKHNGLPLKIAGSGSMLNKLKALKTKNIEFLGRVEDGQLLKLYQGAKALIFPALEDAGIVMLEAMATGTPVIAYGAGGALEFVTPGIHGELFYHQDAQSLQKIVKNFNPENYQSNDLINQAGRFSTQIFREKILQEVMKVA